MKRTCKFKDCTWSDQKKISVTNVLTIDDDGSSTTLSECFHQLFPEVISDNTGDSDECKHDPHVDLLVAQSSPMLLNITLHSQQEIEIHRTIETFNVHDKTSPVQLSVDLVFNDDGTDSKLLFAYGYQSEFRTNGLSNKDVTAAPVIHTFGPNLLVLLSVSKVCSFA